METVDFLLINANILTMDEQFHQYTPGALAITGNLIIAVGPETEITSQYQGQKVVDCSGKTLMPGLVNAHTHVPMTHIRG